MAQRVCSVEGCEKPHSCRGWCRKHYSRWKRHGDPLGGTTSYKFPESLYRRLRFCLPTTMPTGCIEYTGSRNEFGYGLIQIDGKCRSAHRKSYELARGPIPEGLHIDHLCRNPPCVNPAHLEPVTCKENIMRSPVAPAAINAAKTHCPQGHPYDEANTYMISDGRRQCRTCQRLRARARKLVARG